MGLPSFTDFTKHLPGCTPLKRCGTCAAVTLAHEKLNLADRKKFDRLVSGGMADPNLDHQLLNMTLAEFGFETSFIICAKANNVIYIGDLVMCSVDEVLLWKSMGNRRVRKAQTKLRLKDLELGLQIEVEESGWVRPA